MALTETSLIERYFRAGGAQRADVRLGIGDDEAHFDRQVSGQIHRDVARSGFEC